MIIHADLTTWAPEAERYHALLCDPPYEIGFMGKGWDNAGISFDVDFWKRMKDGLLPGAFCMAFSSTRTVHRMMMAIEDAGFILHPMIGWIFGSGFPKATRVATTDGVWKRHRYGGQALKPAFEPIVVFQKPYEGKPAECIQRTGAGALDIEGNKIGNKLRLNRSSGSPGSGRIRPCNFEDRGDGKSYDGRTISTTLEYCKKSREKEPSEVIGRWPANVIIGDEVAKAALDEQSGVLKSGKFSDHHIIDREDDGKIYGKMNGLSAKEQSSFGDKGGASRFFYNVQTQIEAADPFKYQAKATQKERNAGVVGGNNHPTCKPVDLVRHLAALLLPPSAYSPRKLLVPFSGSGSEVIGAKLAGWDEVDGVEVSPEYVEVAQARLAYEFPFEEGD